MKISVKVALLGSAAAIGGTQAHSQDVGKSPAAIQQAENAQSAPSVEEIVVTAQKRSERLGDVPISITAKTGDQLQ